MTICTCRARVPVRFDIVSILRKTHTFTIYARDQVYNRASLLFATCRAVYRWGLRSPTVKVAVHGADGEASRVFAAVVVDPWHF